MSKHDSKPVAYAVMHTPEKVPNASQFGPTLSAKGDGRLKGTPMTISEPWVEVQVPKTDKPGETIKVLIPVTNFKTIVLE